MKNKLARLLVLGFISILVFIGCPNDSSGKGPPVCGEGCECEKCDDVDKPPVCENEDCECEDCDGEECDCNEELDPNLPKEQSVEISLFDGASSATVTGHMTDTQWEGVADTLEQTFNYVLNRFDSATQNIAQQALDNRGFIFIVEVEPDGFEHWKTNGDGKTIYIALSSIDEVPHINDGFTSAFLNGSTITQTLPRNRDNHRGHAKGACYTYSIV